MSAHLVEVMLRPTGEFYVQVFSTAAGSRAWRADGLPQVVEADSPPESLGTTVLSALNRSMIGKFERSTPFDLPSQSPILAWAGVKTWSTYNRDCRVVQVRGEYEADPPVSVTLTPQARDRTGRYSPLLDLRRHDVHATDPGELGAAILRSMEDATA